MGRRGNYRVDSTDGGGKTEVTIERSQKGRSNKDQGRVKYGEDRAGRRGQLGGG